MVPRHHQDAFCEQREQGSAQQESICRLKVTSVGNQPFSHVSKLAMHRLSSHLFPEPIKEEASQADLQGKVQRFSPSWPSSHRPSEMRARRLADHLFNIRTCQPGKAIHLAQRHDERHESVFFLGMLLSRWASQSREFLVPCISPSLMEGQPPSPFATLTTTKSCIRVFSTQNRCSPPRPSEKKAGLRAPRRPVPRHRPCRSATGPRREHESAHAASGRKFWVPVRPRDSCKVEFSALLLHDYDPAFASASLIELLIRFGLISPLIP